MPIGTSEELMIFYIINVEPEVRVHYQDILDDISCDTIQILWQTELSFLDIGKHNLIIILTLIPKRHEPSYHFTHQHSNAPNVHFVIVTLPSHYLWRWIPRRATICVCSVFPYILKLLCEAEIYQFDVALLINQNVLWLQIPIHYIPFYIFVWTS